MRKKTVKDIKNLKGAKVLLTADFNISLINGHVTNDTRIVETLPTIDYLTKKGAKVIIVSHLGRPKGFDARLSLKPVQKRLEKLLGKRIFFLNKFPDKKNSEKIKRIHDGEIILMENIRFHQGEEENDPVFSKELASLADCFVNDAFGTAHRVHASIVGIAEYIKGYAGFLMAKEIEMISHAIENPKKPFLIIIGGAKTPEKISVIERIMNIADTVALGGAIANTFLAAWGFGMGRSLVDYEMVEMARVVFWQATRKHSALILPNDVVYSDKERKLRPHTTEYNKVPHHAVIYDIGIKTRTTYHKLIKEAGTIIWNGPMGLYEDPRFSKGTKDVLRDIAESNAFTIIGGGDTLTSIENKKYLKKINHISTGGSAMLAFMEKGT
ncbi:phosphoglycerate kinase, partial [Candidatus Gottesmanbacteria bacterium RBG_13_37_7]